MPIVPDDFDFSPSRRQKTRINQVAERKTLPDAAGRATGEQQRSSLATRIKQVLLGWRTPLIVGVTAAVLSVVAERPLATLAARLLHKPAPINLVVQPERNQPASTRRSAQPTAQSTVEPPAALISPPRHAPAGNAKALALEQALERRNADLELKERRLADAQAALETQRQQEAQTTANAAEQVRQEEILRTQRLQAQEAQQAREQNKEKQAALVHAQTPSYQGPSSGTLVWQGNLEGADLIDIENGAASQGSLSGQLPGVPVMVQASPADQVTIAIAPGPSNEWKRIVLRVRSKGSKKITVRWVIP